MLNVFEEDLAADIWCVHNQIVVFLSVISSATVELQLQTLLHKPCKIYRDALETVTVGLDSAKLAPEPITLLIIHHILLHLAQFHGHKFGVPLVIEQLLRHLVQHLGLDVGFLPDNLVLLQ